jgi:hypothetical protein
MNFAAQTRKAALGSYTTKLSNQGLLWLPRRDKYG